MTENFEKIESYLEGKMNPDEKKDFEAQLLQLEALKEEFELYKKLRKGITDVYEGEDIKALLRKKEKQIQKKELRIKSYPYAAIAAVLVVVIGVALYFNSDAYQMKQIASEYFIKPDPLPVMMGAHQKDAKIKLTKAMQAYSRKEYQSTLHLLSGIPVSDTVWFYSGVCKYQLDKSPVEDLSSISKQSEFFPKSAYYLFLFYLKSNDIDAAKKQFIRLKSFDNHPYADKIESLASEQFIKNNLQTNSN